MNDISIWAKSATGPTGYGTVGNNFIELLYNNYTTDIQLVTETIHWTQPHCYNEDVRPMMLELINNLTPIPDLNYVLWTPDYVPKNLSAPTILESVFETDKIPVAWVEMCNAVDITWLPSKFATETFKNSGVTNTQYIPYGIKFSDSTETIPQIINDTKFKFLIVNQWSERKFTKQTVRTFCETFTAKDKVILYIRSDPAPGLEPLGINQKSMINDIDMIKKNNPDSPQIILLDRVDTNVLSKIYNSVDCLLSSVRGEGVGRSPIEAMSMGVPAIATNWSSLPEFVNDKNGFLLDGELVNINLPPLEQQLYSLTSDMHWTEPNVQHLSDLMRYVYDHPEEVKRKGERARKDVREQFDWEPLFTNRITSMESIL